MNLPKKVELIEVGPRDGFQSIKEWIPTEIKLEIIEGLIKAGFLRIEATSFVNPKSIPQMKDAQEIIKHLSEKYENKVELIALVPNLIGAKNARNAGVKAITYVISVSEKHNLANVKRTVNQSFDELKILRDELPEMKIKLDFATVFGCPHAGIVPVDDVLMCIQKAVDIGISEVCLCDTIGIANPLQVRNTITKVKERFPNLKIVLHFHDNRGMGMANVLAALTLGIDAFESTLGGLGGCPFTRGAAGLVASEDLVNMLENMGISTGINLSELLSTVNIVKSQIKPNISGHLANIGSCS
jgi:hydroxymethylglutaryl-CoA lyase